ncbi:hypothetical protein EUGRSUZ_A00448 [Eucalyptus grandis]|uniref:Uncharacterized protein n=2 Tax=Eucalyptus grandis TaxID=71139 RepID=A0ACC3M0Z5_EUCGR|nr:hypothetical protein EUGRSUZ_A00448 [Eucalyptus grandis]
MVVFPRECRANAKSTGENEVRNLQLQVQTKVSDTLFTGKKVEGEGGARISVALIDANTGDVVRSDKESFIRLDVVVLKGGFNKDDGDNWTKEEFDSQLVKGGVGELGELIFRDNSRSDDTEKFRIGLKVASGYCENTRIREGKTNAFRVKERRGESNQKHYPPALDDEVWRLDKIAKGGISHQKLERAGIHKVQNFLQHLHNDSKKLREVLGKSITSTHWECLVDHAKTCTNWKTYENHSNNMSKHAAVFNTDRQLTGLINDILYSATDRLSAQEKVRTWRCNHKKGGL